MGNYTRKKWVDHVVDQNGAIVQQGTPMSAGNFNNLEVGVNNANLDVDNANNAIRDAIPSGLVKLSTIDPTFSKTNPNKIKLTGGATAYVNGWKVDIADGTIIDIGVPPTTGEREDLVFLEVWKAQATDTQGEKINSRIRVVQGVDFVKYPEGFHVKTASTGVTDWCNLVTAQGGNTVPVAWQDMYKYRIGFAPNIARPFVYASDAHLGDEGVYVAGQGEQVDKDLTKTADGYCYAIPLFRVRRRNSGGYSVVNPNGAALTFVGVLGITSGSATAAIASGNLSALTVGTAMKDINGNFMKVASIAGNMVTFDKPMTYTSGGVTFYSISSRPDGLFTDVVDDRDILDLRHQVSLTGFNYQALLEENFDKLLRGELQTKERKKMLKVYHGIPKTPVDGNTVFYASMDGTTVAEVGGVPFATNGTLDYVPLATGLGLKLDDGEYVKYNIALTTEVTVDLFVETVKFFKSTTNENALFLLRNADNSNVFGIARNTNAANQVRVSYGSSATVITVAIPSTPITHIRYTVKATVITVYINGNVVGTATLNRELATATHILVSNSATWGYIGALSDLMVSNIDRGAVFATLPADFIAGYARIDKAFNGQRKTHSDALTSQYTIGIAKGAGSGHSKGLTVTQATPGTWASGDTIKVKGLASSIISGVIDSDTALATVTVNSPSTENTAVFSVDDVSKFAVNDIVMYQPLGLALEGPYTINAVDVVAKTVTLNTIINYTRKLTGSLFIETTASTSVPVVKFMNAGTMTTVTGTWTNLSANETTFTLGTNASLVNADIQIEYSLNMAPGQGGIPEVYTATLAGEYKGKKLVLGTVAVRDDLKNKVVGDGNPITVKYIKAASLQLPAAFTTEVANADYTNMGVTGDALAYTLSTSVNGEIPQVLVSVDVVKEIETKYGPIPSVDKVGWVKTNVGIAGNTAIQSSANIVGTGPNGNKVILGYWDASANNWGTYTAVNSTASLAQKILSLAQGNNGIDANGYLTLLIYGDASNGSVVSSITIDSINIDFYAKTVTGYDILVPENPRRDDGLAGMLLVRKETKEIQTYFDAANTDGLVTYGDYLPYQGQGVLDVVLKVINASKELYVSTIGTGALTSDTTSGSILNWTGYASLLSRLPIGSDLLEYDYVSSDLFSYAATSTTNTNLRILKQLLKLPIIGGSHTRQSWYNVNMTIAYSVSASAGSLKRGVGQGFSFDGDFGMSIAAAVPTPVDLKNKKYYTIYPLLVLYKNEIYLTVITFGKLGGDYAEAFHIYTTDGENKRARSIDMYKISNRYLIK